MEIFRKCVDASRVMLLRRFIFGFRYRILIVLTDFLSKRDMIIFGRIYSRILLGMRDNYRRHRRLP